MKKVLFAAIMLCSAGAFAQSTSSPAIDTLTDAETPVLAQPNASYFKASDGTWSVGVVATKISGTTAGYAILQGSIDGTNYSPLTGTSADSVALADVAGPQIKNWFITGTKPAKVRVQFVGSGTQSTQIKAFFIKN